MARVMRPYEYETMFAAEEEHWWYQGLHDQVRKAVLSRCGGAGGRLRVLDAGCGTGKVLESLADFDAFGFDLSAAALALAGKRGLSRLARASIAELPYQSGSFDLVVSLDVLPNVEDAGVPAAMAEFFRVLKPGGKLILNLTAYKFLFSEHDRAIDAYRRFEAREVRKLVAEAGFDLDLLTYSNSLLFLPAAAVRLWKKRRADRKARPRTDLALPSPLVNSILAFVRFFENDLILRRNLRLPFGLSLFCLAAKPR